MDIVSNQGRVGSTALAASAADGYRGPEEAWDSYFLIGARLDPNATRLWGNGVGVTGALGVSRAVALLTAWIVGLMPDACGCGSVAVLVLHKRDPPPGSHGPGEGERTAEPDTDPGL